MAGKDDIEVAVRIIRNRHDWQLLNQDEFVERSSDALRQGRASSSTQAATHVYSLALYNACAGNEGKPRQERAYRELFAYLHRSASHRYGDISEDVTQLAIERIFANFDRCQVPSAFLAWAFQQLRDSARSLRRRNERLPTIELHNDSAHALQLLLTAPPTSNPDEQLAQRDREQRLAKMVEAFLIKHPRAKDQLSAFLLKHLWGLDDVAIAERLDRQVDSIYVLRSRAKKKLQEDPDWVALAQEWDFL